MFFQKNVLLTFMRSNWLVYHMAIVNFDAIISKFCSEFPNPICNLPLSLYFIFLTFLICFHEYFLVLNSTIRFSWICDQPSICYASVNATCAQPPGLLHGISKFSTAQGPGICQPWAIPELLTHAVSYQNITTQKVVLEKSRLAHLSRTGINCRGL